MELEFDKEIDAILRKARDGDEAAASAAVHLDADEISAFAENALPENSRQKFTMHLAECARCRKILSNLISLNAEAEGETSVSTFPAGVVAAPVPWYRRLFAFPQLAYAMGALVLIFSGFMAYIVLQNVGNSQNATIAQREETGERPKGVSGINSDGATVPTFSANTATNAANTTAFSNTTANINTSVAARNTTTNTSSFNTTSTANTAAPTVRATPLPEPTMLAKTERGNVADDAEKNVTAAAPPVAGVAAPKEAPKPQQVEEDKAKRAETRDAAESQVMRSQPAPRAKKPAKSEPGEPQRIGGKTFRRVGGVWFDAAYTRQPQISVRRGSEEYKKLDSGLRSIAESLSGTVVVLWKDKAYRIQ